MEPPPDPADDATSVRVIAGNREPPMSWSREQVVHSVLTHLGANGERIAATLAEVQARKPPAVSAARHREAVAALQAALSAVAERGADRSVRARQRLLNEVMRPGRSPDKPAHRGLWHTHRWPRRLLRRRIGGGGHVGARHGTESG